MAVSLGTPVTLPDDSDGATSTINFTVSSGQSILVLKLGFRTDMGIPTVADDVDGAWSALSGSYAESAPGSVTERAVMMFYLLNPTAGAHVITVTRTTGLLRFCATVNEYAGVETSAPFGTPVIDSETGNTATSSSVAVTDAGNDDLVLDVICIRTTNSPTVGADQTERSNFLIAGATNVRQATSTQPGSVSGDVMSWSWTGGGNVAHCGVALKAAAGGGSTQPPRTMHQQRMRRAAA